MSYQVGDTYYATVSVTDVDDQPTDPDTLTLQVREPDGTVTAYVYGVDDLVVRDEEGEYHADVPLTEAGMWAIDWSTTGDAQLEGVQIAVSLALTSAVTFATLNDLALRLGKASSDDLTEAQKLQGAMLLELVTGTIVDNIGRDDEWAATFSPIPRVVRGVTLEAVARVMQSVQSAISNPSGASSKSETLGAYSHTIRYGENGGSSTQSGSTGAALGLTDAEMRLCRRAILGTLSGSARVDTIVEPHGATTLNALLRDPIYDWI